MTSKPLNIGPLNIGPTNVSTTSVKMTNIQPMNISKENPQMTVFKSVILDKIMIDLFKQFFDKLSKEEDLFYFNHLTKVNFGDRETFAVLIEIVDKIQFNEIALLVLPQTNDVYRKDGNNVETIPSNDLLDYVKKDLKLIPKEVKGFVEELKQRKINIKQFVEKCEKVGYKEYQNLPSYVEAINYEKYEEIKQKVISGKLSKKNALLKMNKENLWTVEREEEINNIKVKKNIPVELINTVNLLIKQTIPQNKNENEGASGGRRKKGNQVKSSSGETTNVDEKSFIQQCRQFGVNPEDVPGYDVILFEKEFKKALLRYKNGKFSKIHMEQLLDKHAEIVEKYDYFMEKFNETEPKNHEKSPLKLLKQTDFLKDEGWSENVFIPTINKAAVDKRMTVEQGIDFIRKERLHSIHSAKIAMMLYAEEEIDNKELEKNLIENGCLQDKFLSEFLELEFNPNRLTAYFNTWKAKGEKTISDTTYEKYLEKIQKYEVKEKK